MRVARRKPEFAALVQGNTTKTRELLEESLTLIKEIDENLIMAYFLLALGLVDLAENNPEARGHIFHSLRLSLKMGAKVTQTSSLVGVAGLALQAGDARGAAVMFDIPNNRFGVD